MRFAVLGEIESLEPWQARCLQELARLPQVRLVAPAAGSSLQQLELDFILSWTDPPAELISLPRYGVWKYEFGDWTNYRGEPAGFWEVHQHETVSAAMLVRPTSDPDAVIVLREGYLRTNLLSAAANRRQLQRCCALWATQLIADIGNGVVARFTAEPRRAGSRPRLPPTRGQLLQHACRIAARLVLKAASDLFRHEQWNVGIVEQPIAAFLGSADRAATRWLPDPRPEEIRADPFGLVKDGRLTVLCEHLSFEDSRGVIVAVEPAAGTQMSHRPVSIGPSPAVHLSYPFLLEVGGRTFCMPETHEAAEVSLYEVERFPDRWRKLATLLSNTVIVDASLFSHGGLWWLAGSEAAPKGANCELHLWYATEMTGPWRAHPGNPVKIDVRSARPGGTPFVHAGVLYRPAQDCSRTYGGRILINRVLTLTPTAFQEETAAQVDPDISGPYPEGLHTLSAVGAVTLIDGKRIRFIPAQFARTLRSWFSVAFGKRRRPVSG